MIFSLLDIDFIHGRWCKKYNIINVVNAIK